MEKYDYKKLIEENIMTPDFVMEKKLKGSKRYSISFITLIERIENEKKNTISVKEFTDKTKMTYNEAWNILNEFSILGFVKKHKTRSGISVFLINEDIKYERLIETAVKTLKGE